MLKNLPIALLILSVTLLTGKTVFAQETHAKIYDIISKISAVVSKPVLEN